MSGLQGNTGNLHLLKFPDSRKQMPSKLTFPVLALALMGLTAFALALLHGCDGENLNSVNDLLCRESFGSLAITVSDTFGSPVKAASVSMGFTQAGTDHYGKARITGFRDGLSAVHVSADGFSPAGVSFEVFRGRETEIKVSLKRAPAAFKASLYFPAGEGNGWTFKSPGTGGVSTVWKVDSTVIFGDGRRSKVILGPTRILWLEVGAGIRITGNGLGDYEAGNETVAYDDTAQGSRIASSYRDRAGLTHRVVWHWQAVEDLSTDAGIFKNCLRARRSETIEGPNTDLTVKDENLWFARGVGIVMGINLAPEKSDALFLENGRLAEFKTNDN